MSHGYGTIIVHHFCHKYLKDTDLNKNEKELKEIKGDDEENVPLKHDMM